MMVLSAKPPVFITIIICFVICMSMWAVQNNYRILSEYEEINAENFIEGPPPLRLFSDDDKYARMYFHERQMKRQVVSHDQIGKNFFQRNWEPSYSCMGKLRLGAPGDGGKWICDPHRALAGPNCIVYSIGSNGDFGFEEAVHNFNPACTIHTFDPMYPPVNKPDFVHFHSWGLGSRDAESIFTVNTMMRHLGHKNISVFKIDCEGCELFSLLPPHFPYGAIQQIAVEVHFNRNPDSIHNLFNSLSSMGYAIFSKEPNIQYSDGNAIEYSLVLLK
jgi:hypothetical protein